MDLVRTLGRSARITAVALLAATSLAGADPIHFHGLLDVVAARRGEAYDQNVLTRGDSPFDAYGLRVFADAPMSDRLQIFTQVMLRDASTPYVDGAYAMITPAPGRDFHLLAGKVPWPIGTYGPRTYSNKNPLIGAPLMYQYHSTLLWYEMVPGADALLATAGSGQYGVDYFGYAEGRGMPVIDDCYWDVGATLVGSEKRLEYSLGLMAGTPGWGSTGQDENSGKSVLGRLGLVPWPGVRLGVSGAYGPYLVASLKSALPPGRSVEDYHQRLGMADAEWLAGHLEVRAEGALNTWETPTVGDLDVATGYVEMKYAFSFGGFVAGRWDTMRFGSVTDSTGARRPWNHDLTRFESGAGFRFDRNAIVKVVYQQSTLAEPAGARDVSLVAAQLSVSF